MKNKTVKISSLFKLALAIGVVYSLVNIGEGIEKGKRLERTRTRSAGQVASYKYEKAQSKLRREKVYGKMTGVANFGLDLFKIALNQGGE